MTKTELENLVASGATLADVAAQLNVSWEEAIRTFHRLDVQLPSAAQPYGDNTAVQAARSLVPDGTDEVLDQRLVAMLGYPKIEHKIDIQKIYETFHGTDYLDSYTGQPVPEKKIFPVSANVVTGGPRNFLITNLECLSQETINSRFSRWMQPIQESFDQQAGQFNFRLTVYRAYDRKVGGTYSPSYVRQLFDRWVGQPILTHQNRSPDKEPVFLSTTPFHMAWWAWIQLTHAGLLKGLIELRVQDKSTGQEIQLADDSIMSTLLGSIPKTSSSIIMPGRNGAPKFDTSILQQR